MLARFNGIEILRKQIAQADLRWSVGRFFLAMLLGGAATWTILGRMEWIPRLAAISLSVLVAAGPYLIILRRRGRKLLLFEEQFPDALDTLARSLRAGNALAGAMQILSRETKAPVGPELRKAVDERNLGLTWEQSLGNLSKRVPIQEVAMFAAAVQLQSRTGGKLHEVLARLAENMRESSALKGEIRAVAAHGKMTGAILTAMPIIITGIMMLVNPNQMAILFTDPTGKTLLFAAAGCLVAAHFIIRKLTDIKI
jgi:tight adherence protein B